MTTDTAPDITELTLDSAAYPEKVKALMGTKAPASLFAVGSLRLLEKDAIGFCGSRKASERGLETVRDCAFQAANAGVVVVSGNAAGVDFSAHYVALEAGGETILVLPEGINHFQVKRALRPVWDWERVLVLSQFRPDTPWRAFQAMSRNQVIIALSGAMVVIEAGEKGGTISAGLDTLKLNIPLYVAEYKDMNEIAVGNRTLISKGGKSLRRSATTGKANMSNVFKDVHQKAGWSQPTPQLGLF